MKTNYCGGNESKDIARNLVFKFTELLCGLDKGNILCLASSEAGDVLKARELGVEACRVYAAEIDSNAAYRAGIKLLSEAGNEWAERVFCGDVENVTSEYNTCSLVWLDWCGGIGTNILKKSARIIKNELMPGGVFAITMYASRECGDDEARAWLKSTNRYGYDPYSFMKDFTEESQFNSWMSTLQRADTIQHFLRKYFPGKLKPLILAVIKYCGKNGSPMIVVIGKLSSKGQDDELQDDTLGNEPYCYLHAFYYISIDRNKITINRGCCSPGIKASLPKAFKEAA